MMKIVIKKLSLLIVVIIIALFIAPVANASDITNAQWYGIFSDTNNSSASATNVAAITSINSSALIAQGFVNSSFTDCTIQDASGTDAPHMPGYGTSPCVFYSGNFSTYETKTFTMYTGNVTGGEISIFPLTMTVVDDTTKEIGNNGAINLRNFMPRDGTVFSKSGAWNTSYSSTTGNLTVSANMSSPAIASNTTGASNGVANFSATLPTGHTSGDGLLLLVFVYDSTQVNPTDPATLAGYTALFTATSGANVRIAAFWKIDGGAEGNPTVTVSSTNAYYAYNFLRISNPGTPIYGTTASGTSTTPDPPNVAATGSNLYIAVAGTGSGPANYSSAPAGYTQVVRNTSGGVTMVSSSKLASGAQNPGTYTFTSSGNWLANTIAIPISACNLNFHPGRLPISDLTISANNTSGNFEAWENGTKVQSVTMSGGSINDNSNPWIFQSGILYVQTIRFIKAGSVVGLYSWEYPDAMSCILTNGSGSATGSPKTLSLGSNNVTITGAGTFTIANSYGWRVSAVTGSATVTGSPKECPSGQTRGSTTTTTITVVGTGYIMVTVARCLTDQTANNNDAVTVFRTTSSDTDVATSFISFGPVTEARASSTIVGSVDPWTTAPSKPSGFTSPTGAISIPLVYTVIHGFFMSNPTYGTAAEKLFWFISAMMVVLIGGFLSQKYGKSILLKAFVMGALILGGALSNVYGLWTLIVFACYAFGIIIMSRHYGFG